jgi:hypothetical protein
MMGADVDVPCDGCELLFEVLERSTASLNSFTCFGEVAPELLGGGGAFLTVSVEPMLMPYHLKVVSVCCLQSLSMVAREAVMDVTPFSDAPGPRGRAGQCG